MPFLATQQTMSKHWRNRILYSVNARNNSICYHKPYEVQTACIVINRLITHRITQPWLGVYGDWLMPEDRLQKAIRVINLATSETVAGKIARMLWERCIARAKRRWATWGSFSIFWGRFYRGPPDDNGFLVIDPCFASCSKYKTWCK